MSSTLFVDAIEPNLSSGVHIAGGTVQTVRNTLSTGTTINSTSFMFTNLEVTITPKFATSKILLMFTPQVFVGGNYDHGMGFRIDRVISGSAAYIYQDTSPYDLYVYDGSSGTEHSWGGFRSLNYLDTPSTLLPITYKLYARSYRTDFANNTAISSNNAISSVIAQEIAQ